MMLAHRNFKTIAASLFEKRHYRALVNMFYDYERPIQLLYTYLTGKGNFPQNIRVSSPRGPLNITLYSYYDLLTLNEIFCRKDYAADHLHSLKCVVDLGSNIGISASYFLSRNSHVKVYAYEPVPTNSARLKAHMEMNGFSERIELTEAAVSNFSGKISFGVEASGRYGGIGLPYEQTLEVDVHEINHVLERVLQKEERIDILKIDTEGAEKKIIEAIHPQLAQKIDLIYAESLDEISIHDGFSATQYGTITKYAR